MHDRYDVVIVGGGLVGLFLALVLSKSDFTVALIEQKSLHSTLLSLNTFQTRVSAINPGCKILFEQIGIWEKIQATGRISSYENMFVWDSLGRGNIHFDCTKVAQPSLGYIIENAVINNILLNELNNYRNFTAITATEPTALHYINDEEIAIKLNDKKIAAKLIVGADGAKSWVRSVANMDTITWPYHHEALVTNVNVEKSHQRTAWQCFLPDGPLALLPLTDPHQCSIVWSSIPNEIARLRQLPENEFNFELTNAFEEKLGKITKIAPLISVPLVMIHAKEYVKARIALVGDAAHTIHPLAGQGINIGFQDAAVLAENIIRDRTSKKDWGSYIQLRDYERHRKSENWLMILGMEGFKRLFQTDSQFFINTRSFGLKMVDNFDFLKNKFIHHAMGLN